MRLGRKRTIFLESEPPLHLFDLLPLELDEHALQAKTETLHDMEQLRRDVRLASLRHDYISVDIRVYQVRVS